MAKDKKTKKTEEKTEAPEFKYGVQDIADELGIKPASVRVQLRNKGIEKAGKSYGWNTKSELKEVISELSAGKDDDSDEAPKKKAKKSKAKDETPKAEKKSKSKKAKKAKKAKDEDDDDEDEDDDD